jgi:hypothetical protein
MWQSSGVRTVALSFTTSDSCWGFYLRLVVVRRLQQGSCSRAYARADRSGNAAHRPNQKRLQSKQTIYVPRRSYLEPIRCANEMLLGLCSEWALQTVRVRARRREERGRVKSLRPHGGTPNVSTQINANPQKRDKHRLPFVADQYFCLFDSALKPLIAW